MSRTEKAGEPSMEEILASIRKIIAEDPVAPKLAVEPSIAALAAFKPAAKPDTVSSVASLSAIPVEAPRTASARIEPSWPSSSMSQNQPSASTSPAPAKSGPPAAAGMVAATSLDDVLGLADDSPPIASFGPSLSVSPSLQASIAAGALPLTEPRRSSLSPERAPVQPFFPPQTRDALAGVTQSRSASPETGLASFGAVVPNRADSRAFGATSDNSKLELSSRHPDLTVGGPRMERIPPNDWATANPQRATSELRSDAEPAPRIEAKIDAKPGDALSPGSGGTKSSGWTRVTSTRAA